MCCAQPRGPTTGFSSKEITFIEDWLAKREAGDAEGAAADCTPDVVVETPGTAPVTGIDAVKSKIFSRPAVRPIEIVQNVQEKRDEPGVFYREAIFEFTKNTRTRIRRELTLINSGLGQGLKISKIVLHKL